MLNYSLIAYSALLIALISTIAAVKGRHQLYWVAAIAIYIFSFIAGFSIGQLTVGLTFIPLTLALGFTLGWIKSKLHSTMAVGIGVLIGFLMVAYAGKWVFFPVFKIFSL